MKKIIMPTMPASIGAQERQRLGLHGRRGVDEIEQSRRREPADDAEHHRHPRRRQERLIDDAIHLVAARLAPANRATSTPIPLNTELANTMTTMTICQLTPMAALAV